MSKEYDVKIDKDTFDAVICDCYRHVHPPLMKKKIMGNDGVYRWKQVPYHYGESWDRNNNMDWLEKLKI